MTTWTKPVSRETAVSDRGRTLIATLHARHIEIRPKGLRKGYSLSYDAIMWLAIKRDLEERRREKLKAKRARR